MKPIDADAFKAKIEQAGSNGYCIMSGEYIGVDAVMNWLNDAPAVMDWTPVSESLPPEEGWYLVTAENDFGEIREMVTWFTPANDATGSPAVWGNYSKAELWKNLAWLELPEPYKKGE